jgi:hypothetical protein
VLLFPCVRFTGETEMIEHAECESGICDVCLMKKAIWEHGLADILETVASAASELSAESDTLVGRTVAETIDAPVYSARYHDDPAFTSGRLDKLAQEIRKGC